MDLLSGILAHLRLRGTLYFRTSFTSPWGLRVPVFKNVARFHFVYKGRCLARVGEAADPIQLSQGDLFIIPHGAMHTLYSDHGAECQSIEMDEIIEKSGFNGRGTLVYGEPGKDQETQLICGHFAFDRDASHPLIEALPSSIHIEDYGEDSGGWLESTLRVIGGEAGRGGLGSDLISQKLSEIIFAQVLRSYLNAGGADETTLAGLSDPNIARVLMAIHEQPAFQWSLDELAKTAGMSRTSFVGKFSLCLGMTPHAYVSYWRMQVARLLIAETKEPISQIASDVGYPHGYEEVRPA